MNTNTFEEYLMEVHAKDYRGTDDDMPDSFYGWLEQLDGSEIMKYAEEAIAELNGKLKKK